MLVAVSAHAQTFGCNPPQANPIVCENSNPGNPPGEWDISGFGDPSIQGFATDISVNQGQTVHFKVNTTASSYRLDIYRMGYYNGMGARKVATILPSVPLPQNQPACVTDGTTGLVDCGNWGESASWAVPANAPSGIYFAVTRRLDTLGASHIMFIVRADTGGSKLLFQTSDTTWQAYNNYGSNSLYGGAPAGRAYKLSYNRPYNTRGNGAGPSSSWVFNAEYPMVRWLEANGYDVSYFTGVDSDRYGAKILSHKVFLSVGHDEYWSGSQRANVEAARAAAVNLAFFSGNEVFWKTRWENSIDGSNTPYRTLVCYKETHAGVPIDPMDPPTWTGTWRDPRFSPPADGGRPENALSGTMFKVNGTRNDAILVPASYGQLRFWRNTSIARLAPGSTYAMPTGTLGYEWDVDADNGFRPAGLFDMSSTTLDVSPLFLLDYGSNYGGGIATHNLTFYRANSGALVFGAGTVQWSWGLDANHDNGSSIVDLNMQQATVNLFADMGVQPATLQPGLLPASASTDIIAPTSTITAPVAGANVQTNNPITITGTSSDAGGGIVAGVEVSTDGGTTWHRAAGLGNWSYIWTPGPLGPVTLKSRAVDDSGNLEVPSAGIAATIILDTTPPVISGVQASPITNAWATITWSTNKLSDGQIDYGTTTAYGNTTTLDSTLVTSHSFFLGGLTPTTLYHFRVRSRDVSGNLAISPDFTFTTTFTNQTINVTFDSFSANPWVPLNGPYPAGVIDWGSGKWLVSGPWGAFTNNSVTFSAAVDSMVSASFTFLSRLRLLSLDAYNGGLTVSTFTVSCPGQPNTQVTLASGQVLSISTGWNDACSPVTIGSSNGWNTNFNNLFLDSPPITPLAISGVQATAITCAGSTISWKTDKGADSQVEYGTTTAYGNSTLLDPTLVTNHSVALSGLTPFTLYHYRVKSKDSSGSSSVSADFTFTTTAADFTPPMISGVQTAAITNSSAYITWNTDKVSTSQVDYGTTTAYGTSTPLDSMLVISHSVVLSGLNPGTSYHFRVKGRDLCGNTATSADFTFNTSSVPPNTIWGSIIPSVAFKADPTPVELGVKFTSDVAGYITGLRFYKGSGNTGTHMGNLWTSTGALLASANFSNETPSGWQQVSFGTPVAIAANTVYVASYHTNVGYAEDQGYFSTAYDNAPLHALRDGVSGGNGVYLYGTGGFPASTYNSSNYWVDVVFVPSAAVLPPLNSISAVQASAITNSSSYIQWSTDRPADSQVDYGLTVAYGASTPLYPALVTSHSVLLNGLSPNTLYHYRVKSQNASASLVTSADFTFNTSSVPPNTIWGSIIPSVAFKADPTPVELGVKFTSDVAGYITGLRFYKGSGNTGTHMGNLWTSTGALLASANFSNETPSGWQQVSFGTPVAIAANTVYVASYHTNVGYSVDQGYFSTSYDNAPLHALRDGVSGGDGVYWYGAGNFPTYTYISSNYWVDVIFVAR